MNAGGGVHGLDPWLRTLGREIEAQPVPASIEEAIEPLRRVGVNVAAVQAAADRLERKSPADRSPTDWRHTHPDFPLLYALAMHIYTLQDPNVYTRLNRAMYDTPNRGNGPGGISAELDACLPFIKLLDVALVEAAIAFGFFVGQVFRGVKHAFPSAAAHDPERYFPVGRELPWFQFCSSSEKFDVMFRPWFCGRTGPRTIFKVRSCEGVSVKPFSAMPDEDEVLFRPLARFRVTASTRQLLPTDLQDPPAPANQAGFPDDVQLVQLATPSTQWVEEQRRERLRESMAAQRRLRAELVASQQQVRQAEQARQAAEQAQAEAEAALLQLAPNEGVPPGPELTFAYCSRKARGQGTTACFHAGGRNAHSPAVCGEVLAVAAGRPVYWKATLVELTGRVLLGVIGNAQPADGSHKDPTCFSWASGGVWIAGQHNNGHGGWPGGWQAGDVAVFKLEAQRLSVQVQRLGDRTFTMDTNGAQNLRIHVNLLQNPTRVQLSRAEPGDEF
eukprot:COSAG06_NODE_792_length_12273_cov_19.284048_1_plen_502_part_00